MVSGGPGDDQTCKFDPVLHGQAVQSSQNTIREGSDQHVESCKQLPNGLAGEIAGNKHLLSSEAEEAGQSPAKQRAASPVTTTETARRVQEQLGPVSQSESHTRK
jgi:hypothetical protein